MVQEWKQTTEWLWDADEGLHYRDRSFIRKLTPNGKTVTGEELWTRSFADGLVYQPACDGGMVFFHRIISGNNSELRAIDAKTGSDIWSAPHAAQTQAYLTSGVAQTPVVRDGKVLLFANGGLCAVNLSTFKVAWVVTGYFKGIPAAAPGSFKYQPDPSNDNDVTFTYRVVAAGKRYGPATVTIRPVTNAPPIIESGPWADPETITLPKTISVGVMASDPDNGPSALSYAWVKADGPGVVEFVPNNSIARISSASFSKPGVYTLRITVSDGQASISSSIQVTVKGPGDLNGDGLVSIDDLVLVTSHFGQSRGNAHWDPSADANGDGDGVVNVTDLTEVTSYFGRLY